MVVNTGLIRYILLNVSIQDKNWIDTYSNRLINFATETDDNLEALAIRYPEWSSKYFQEKTTDRIFVSGTYFDSYTTIDLNAGGFIPLSQVIMNNFTPKQWRARFYNNNPTYLPPSSAGVLQEIYISGNMGISYIGGKLPPYITKITITNTAITEFDFQEIPKSCVVIDLADNLLTDPEVDKILLFADQNGAENGVLNLSGTNPGSPSPQGFLYGLNLLAKGWTVYTN